MRFFHEGQFHGRNKFVSMHSRFRPPERIDAAALVFYKDLLRLLGQVDEVHHGRWAAGVVTPSNDQDPSFASLYVSFMWLPRAQKAESYGLGDSKSCVMVLSNLSDHQSHGHIRLPESSPQFDSLRNIFSTHEDDSCVVVMSDIVAAPISETSAFLVNEPISAESFLNTKNTGERAWFSLDPWETHVYRLSVVKNLA